ncbi:phospholipid-transporting ATPase ABCA3 isoform X2 [Tribolium castaneum]|nr:PREDICTED: ATP-binding cassette sub-family A member 3-like [Tribolium castaneum]|eukprot:XP_015840362.1 PREDICTED: ATP-binding cassette sub-family A member 3-like [Tribolium castaneum]
MANRLNKFILLMWKNWTLLRRRPIQAAFEIIYPVLICLILVAVRGLINVSKEGPISYDPFIPASTMGELCSWSFQDGHRTNITMAYSPTSPLLEKVFENLCLNVTPPPNLILKSYRTAAEMNADIPDNRFNFALQLDDSLFGLDDSSKLPENVDVTLRFPSEDSIVSRREWYTNLIYPLLQTPGPRSSQDNWGGEPGYVNRGFLYAQAIITKIFINNGENIPLNTEVVMQRFPYPEWLNDAFYLDQMETMVSLMIMMSFMFNYVNAIRAITTEKEKQLKESMKVMGLPGWLHWMAWFLRSFVILLIAIILITIVLKVNFQKNAVFVHSDGTVLFVFFILFACSTITFTFLISVFFSKANTATAVGSLVFFLTYLPYTLQQQQGDIVSLGSALSSSLLANSGLSFAISVILKFEAIEEGSQWSNLFSTVSPDDNLTLGAFFLMFILDTFLYLCIALYIEAVFPGDFGVPQPWYFPFTRAYWCNNIQAMGDEQSSENKGEFYEDFTEKLPVGIQLKNLSKTFGGNKAVINMNLDMYEGHITVLLGHNGAGKTTTMSMITGMFPPTSGTAIVSGYDVRTSIQNVRDSMGLCLQHNVLFDNLTVWEHLYFFGKLKGLRNDEINEEIDRYLKLLELEDKRDAHSSTLSGGMKRKLSVGMALCGKSKVVMLDEPTAGMDPSARRAIWNLLQKQKSGRTILLTTHYMDEADLLGDRIAIMTGGELQCCGSSFFLKKKYGAGYYLIMDVTPNCQPSKITQLLQNYIPNVQIHSHVGSELTYQLPENESWKFEKMLGQLENESTSLGVQSYGVSLTTLEEVFMKVGADHDNKLSKKINGNSESTITVEESGLSSLNIAHLSGFNLLRNQFIAIVLKKNLSLLRSWYLFLLQVILPVALLIITVLNARGYAPKTSFPALKMSLESYNEPITLVQNDGSSLANTYINMLNGYPAKTVNNLESEIINLTKESPSTVKRHYTVAASFNSTVATAWFNGDPYHSTSLSLSLVLNTVYKSKFGEKKTLNFINHPLPLSKEAELNNMQFNLMVYQIAMELGYGMAFVASFYILFYIRERVSKSKHLQFVSGVNAFVFWGTAFLCDLITYLITVIFVLITFAVLQEDGFKTTDEIGRITLVLVYFGFFVLPFVYLTSYLFSIPSSGFSRMMLLGAVSGIVGITAMQVLEIEALGVLYVARPLHWVLLFVPFYTVAKGAYDVGSISTLRDVCLKNGASYEQACAANSMCCNIDNYYSFDTPGIGRNIVISFLMSFILFAVLLINEYGLFSYVMNKIINYNKPPLQNVSLESDVQEENEKIRNTSEYDLTKTYSLVLRDVTKYYKNFLAVNGLCLGVKPYECFGLLGVNGAGKTTTFKMMTGDEQISYGEAWVLGHNIKTEQKQVQKLIGYCPQFDALLDDLTVKETLLIFGLIRGIPYKKCIPLAVNLAHEFDFYKHIHKKVKELSGGNKRKLSTALALIGDPPIIYLDEPTAGMDPATKRFLWTALAKLRDRGKCIVLTSHSMEECEALCTRIAIMVNGTFQCLGSTQRLKNKFAQGYALTIKVKKHSDNVSLDDEITVIDRFIQTHFPGAELKEKYQELVSYQLVNNSSLTWSKMFGILERGKKDLNIEDYSLGQCSLEQVFLSFTKYQN